MFFLLCIVFVVRYPGGRGRIHTLFFLCADESPPTSAPLHQLVPGHNVGWSMVRSMGRSVGRFAVGSMAHAEIWIYLMGRKFIRTIRRLIRCAG